MAGTHFSGHFYPVFPMCEPVTAIAIVAGASAGMQMRGGATAARATKAQGEAAANQTMAQAAYNEQAYKYERDQSRINAQIYEENAKRIEAAAAEDAAAIQSATVFQYRRMQEAQEKLRGQAQVAFSKSGVVTDDGSTPMLVIAEQARQDSLNLFAAWDSGMAQRRQALEKGQAQAYQQRQGAQQQYSQAKFKEFQVAAEGPLAVFKAQSQTAAAAAGAKAARAGGVAAGTGSLLTGAAAYYQASGPSTYGNAPGGGSGSAAP